MPVGLSFSVKKVVTRHRNYSRFNFQVNFCQVLSWMLVPFPSRAWLKSGTNRDAACCTHCVFSMSQSGRHPGTGMPASIRSLHLSPTSSPNGQRFFLLSVQFFICSRVHHNKIQKRRLRQQLTSYSKDFFWFILKWHTKIKASCFQRSRAKAVTETKLNLHLSLKKEDRCLVLCCFDCISLILLILLKPCTSSSRSCWWHRCAERRRRRSGRQKN